MKTENSVLREFTALILALNNSNRDPSEESTVELQQPPRGQSKTKSASLIDATNNPMYLTFWMGFLHSSTTFWGGVRTVAPLPRAEL